jgi:hypothetical protein
MSLELWSTIAFVGTFVVVAASSVAALIQLRHLRDGNQLQGVLRVLDLLQDPANRELLDFVRCDLATQMRDESFVTSLHEVPVDRIKHRELYVCQLYEHIGSYVRSGLIAERAFMQAIGTMCCSIGGLLEPTIRAARDAPAPRAFIFENFEWLAAKALSWADKHPAGNYPANLPRMTKPMRGPQGTIPVRE